MKKVTYLFTLLNTIRLATVTSDKSVHDSTMTVPNPDESCDMVDCENTERDVAENRTAIRQQEQFNDNAKRSSTMLILRVSLSADGK